jgi:hypothetical protein
LIRVFAVSASSFISGYLNLK